jgi:pyruvate-formate lyase-activating enzyme
MAAVGAVVLTPYVAALFHGVELAIRDALGLAGDVRIRHTSSRREHDRVVDFDVLLPNGVVPALRLAAPAAIDNPWKTSAHLWLTTRRLPAAPDPLEDADLGPCLVAIGKLFARAQKQRGEELARRLWEHYGRAHAFAEVTDAFYCKVFDGVTGRSANLRLGFGCNQDCGLCWQGRRWPEPPAEMFATWLEELGRGGIEQVSITGGEPTLHPSLPGLLGRARELGMRTMLQTNAIQLRRPELLDRIVRAGLHRLFVSLHAADPAISDRMTRAPGTHRRTVEGIHAALAAGLRVGLNCVVERENYRVLQEHAAFVVEQFVAQHPQNPVESVNYSRPQSYYDRQLWRESIVAYDELEPHVLAAARTLRRAGVVLDVTSGSCGLVACVMRSVPELICLPRPEQMAAMPFFEAAARAGTACERCALAARCQGPGRGYFEVHGDRGLHPFAAAPPIPEAFPLTLD